MSTTTTAICPLRLQRLRPRRCPYRDHTFHNIGRLCAILLSACMTVSLSFLGCRVEEPSPIIRSIFTNLPYPLPSPLLNNAPTTLTPTFRYTSLAIWFLSSLTLLVFAHGIALLYPRRLLLFSVLFSVSLSVFTSTGLLQESLAVLGLDAGLAGWEVTWRELGVLVVPWSVVVGLCGGMVWAGGMWRWGGKRAECARRVDVVLDVEAAAAAAVRREGSAVVVSTAEKA